MAANILVDSSFFIDRLRVSADPFEEFAARADQADFLTCGVVVAEVLRGVKFKRAHAHLASLLGCMIYVPTLNRVWERVAKLAWELDRAGKGMQIPDLVIAACALDADAAVLTMDGDFARVPGLRVISRLV